MAITDRRTSLLYARYLWGPLFPRSIGSQDIDEVGEVFFAPIDIPWSVLVDRIIYQVGSAGVGNVRLGIYREGLISDSPEGGALVVESASVAQSAANHVQLVPIIETVLQPGQHFIGIQGDASGPPGSYQKSMDSGTSLCYTYYGEGYGPFVDPCPGDVDPYWLQPSPYIPFFGLRVKENYPAAAG